ncbi:unnamed protein product [Hermetia illucens]|uniref:MADF domain-containing protein n=1 Tax=Hermetia illucens TaxID=343691 RepID=A0A7R8UX23_HERIL|nr:uncharacterized protein LOC119653703 [Hermetia illucens]CAD7088669.1 unnamed protein product [Hermetia illucens]
MRIDEAKLIEEVKKRRPLWDPRLKSYQSRELKWKLWNEVAESLDISRDAAQKKFKNMKDIFRRELKRNAAKAKQRADSINSTNSEMDSASSTSSKWRLFDDMVFLKDCLDVRSPRVQKVPIEESSTDLDNFDSELSDSLTDSFATLDDINNDLFSAQNQTTVPILNYPPKRKSSMHSTPECKKFKSIDLESLAQILNAETEKNYQDDDYSFLISFYPYIKRMPELSKLQFRVRMQELLYNTMAEIEAANSLNNALQVQISYASPGDVSDKTIN